MVGPEPVDVIHSLLHTVHKLHGDDEFQIFCTEIVLAHNLTGDDLRNLFCATDLNTGILQNFPYFRQECAGNRSINKKRLDSIAGRRVLAFGVNDNRKSFGHITVFVRVNMADAVRMSHDRYLCVVHDVSYKCI